MSVATHWNQEAETYDATMHVDPSMRALHDEIMKWVPLSARRALDLGTGTGALLKRLRSAIPDCHLLGIDPSAEMLARASANVPGADLTIASAHDLRTLSGSFDVVVSNFALHHLTHEQKRQCACEMARVLAPGGRCVFGDQYIPRMGSPEDPEWLEQVLTHLSSKARHFLRTAGRDRMLLQVRMMPRFLNMDGELPCTVAFWEEAMHIAGFSRIKTHVVEPAFLLHSVMVAEL